ncbi:hypothetical protein [Pseudohongiella sp.]|uniref:Uncharacterized protein n=1 Tax=marine sediment metagenome TaxID=412755 RepID=A0A0F9WIU2_9ZZZZ|nr:hypothetical protein [Pseudohongiella sp.]HDZ07594.1 hypothetical protein [Pseudohongiella sp.]HEA64382.1 hypothetical protein [Pseudohongiella sp.]
MSDTKTKTKTKTTGLVEVPAQRATDLPDSPANRTGFDGSDWRILFGLAVTLVWLLLGMLYISLNVGWSNFGDLPIDEMGNFLEGAFAPLAFLWLVIGLFIQQTVLAQNNRELYHSNVVSARQAEALAANERNARQETFFKIADNTRRQLGGISGLLLQSAKGPAGDASITDAQFMEMWHQFATGDFEIFSRRFLILSGRSENMLPLFYGTQIRTTHTENFIVNFDRLLKLARECDINGIITDAQLHSAHGLLSSKMRELHPRIKFRRYELTRTSTYLDQIMKNSQEEF